MTMTMTTSILNRLFPSARSQSRNRKQRLAAAQHRRNKLGMRRLLEVEPLEGRRLLATLFWQGDTSMAWSDPTNWNTAQDGTGIGVAPQAANSDILVFDTTTTGVTSFTSLNDIVGLTDIEIQIVDNDPVNEFFISGLVSIELGANGVSLTSDGNATIDAGLTLSAANTSFSLSGGTLTILGVIDGAGGISKVGPGNLQLVNANTYTGVTNVIGGVISIQNNDALGANSGNTVVGQNGLLDTAAMNLDSLEPITFNGGGIRSFVPGTLSGPITLDGNIQIAGTADLNIAGQVTGGFGLTIIDPIVVTLSNPANDYGGATNISAGTLALGASDVIPNTSAVTVDGVLDLAGFSDTVESLTGDGDVQNGGTLTVTNAVSPGLNGPGDLTIDGILDFSANGVFNVDIEGTLAGTEYDQLVIMPSSKSEQC
jgi:autotransporter-associated beta strand protein